MNRKRITITLKNELFKRLESMVDGGKIRSRSHAIEYLLSESLLKKPVKVLILAGGSGVNFPHLSGELPKAMLPLDGRPLLEYTIERLKQAGLTDITVSLGAHGRKISDHFRNGSRFGVQISYLQQLPGKSGTAQPIKQAQEYFGENIFLLLYGDVLAEINYLDLIEFHRSQMGLVCTMALTSVEKVSMWGVAKLVGSKIVEFEEKPRAPRTHSHLVNAGIYVLEPDIFKFIRSDILKLESGVFPRLAEESRLGGYIFEGSWYDVSTQEVYSEVLRKWGK